MNPTIRGFAIVAAIAAIIVAFSLGSVLGIVFLILRIAFLVALAWFLYTLYRNNRYQLSLWSRRARWTFLAAAGLAAIDLVVFFWLPATGLNAVAFVLVLILAGTAMWRVWRNEHTYS
jgi:hypothetical protein